MADIDQLQGKTFNVDTETTGFYAGFSKTVVVGAKASRDDFIVCAELDDSRVRGVVHMGYGVLYVHMFCYCAMAAIGPT